MNIFNANINVNKHSFSSRKMKQVEMHSGKKTT